MDDIEATLRDLIAQYPQDMQDFQRIDLARQLFLLAVVTERVPVGGRVADLGGGISSFSAVCASLGRRSTLVDDFYQVEKYSTEDPLLVHKAAGVEIVSRDVLTDGLGFEPASMDLIATFDCMEHWHHSPKALFAEVVTALRPGGWFFLGVPNSVNLRKRVTGALGRNKWSQMADWYEKPHFRGHVREPDVDDLRYIARDMALEQVSILGRNWLGYRNAKAWVRTVTPWADRILQRRPSLCADIYLLARKPLPVRVPVADEAVTLR